MTSSQRHQTFDALSFQIRYRSGEWRGPIFRDMVLSDLSGFPRPTVLDIGCGKGFDGSIEIQRNLVESAGVYFGIDPDPNVTPASFLTSFTCCTLEETDFPDNSVDLAFCVMVLEHIADPARFWSRLNSILKPDGVFWGFTVDIRHPFGHISWLTEKLRLKNWYLDRLRGNRGVDRYENFPTHYRANSPHQIRRLVPNCGTVDFFNFSRIGQLDFYYPAKLRIVAHLFDYVQEGLRLPGHLLAMRWKKS